jgi:hypothetical protein
VEKGGRKKYVTEMEAAPVNGKESSHSAHANGMNEFAAVSTSDSTAFNDWITG